MCITKQCADPVAPGVYWREDDRWVKYSDAISAGILATRKARGANIMLGRFTSVAHPGGDDYMIDFTRMEQVNVRSGYRREVKIIGEPSQTFASTVNERVHSSNIKSNELSHQIEKAIEAILLQMCEEKFLKKIIVNKFPRYRSFRPLTDVYAQFMAAVQEAAKRDNSIMMEMYTALKLGDVDALKSIQFIFRDTEGGKILYMKFESVELPIAEVDM